MEVLIAQGGGASAAMRRALEGRGYEIVEARDGAEALEMLLADAPPRLALADWDLPGIDGPELCRLVRSYHLALPPYIVLLTPASLQRDVSAGLEAGANDVVRTPVSGSELRARIELGRRVVELPWGRVVGEPHGPAALKACLSDLN